MTRRFPGRSRRRFDSPALVLSGSAGMGYFGRRGLSGLSPLAQAIATAEGYGPAGNVPTIANNPGDLELGNQGAGVTVASGGQQITNFPTLEAGQAALENQINLIATGQSKAGYTPDMSIAQVGALYSGSQNGNWANQVAAALGVTPDANFASLAGGSPPAAAPAQPVTVDTSGDSSGDISLADSLAGLTSTDYTPYIIGAAVIGALALALT